MTSYSHFQTNSLRSLLTQHAYYSTRTLLTRCCTMRHCNEHKLSALQVGWPEQNTALNPKFLTAKISATALKPATKSPPIFLGWLRHWTLDALKVFSTYKDKYGHFWPFICKTVCECISSIYFECYIEIRQSIIFACFARWKCSLHRKIYC